MEGASMKKLLLSLVLLSSSLSLVAAKGDYPCDNDGNRCKQVDNQKASRHWAIGFCEGGQCCTDDGYGFKWCQDSFLGEYQLPHGVY